MVDMPIYFLEEDEKGLTGGAAITWNSDNSSMSFRFFIGDSFGIFSKLQQSLRARSYVFTIRNLPEHDREG